MRWNIPFILAAQHGVFILYFVIFYERVFKKTCEVYFYFNLTLALFTSKKFHVLEIAYPKVTAVMQCNVMLCNAAHNLGTLNYPVTLQTFERRWTSNN